MGWLAIIQIAAAILGLVRQGIVTAGDLKAVFDKYKGQTPDPATIEAMRNDLLDLAKRVAPGLDPAVIAQLKADGLTPADIGL